MRRTAGYIEPGYASQDPTTETVFTFGRLTGGMGESTQTTGAARRYRDALDVDGHGVGGQQGAAAGVAEVVGDQGDDGLGVRGLEQGENRQHVGAAGARPVLIDENLSSAARLRQGSRRDQQDRRGERGLHRADDSRRGGLDIRSIYIL